MFTTPAQFHDAALEKSDQLTSEIRRIVQADGRITGGAAKAARATRVSSIWSAVFRHFRRCLPTTVEA
jgi:hypothetical protein